jgi:hypothetical protein
MSKLIKTKTYATLVKDIAELYSRASWDKLTYRFIVVRARIAQ